MTGRGRNFGVVPAVLHRSSRQGAVPLILTLDGLLSSSLVAEFSEGEPGIITDAGLVPSSPKIS